ncbi:hypothetical protein D3C87_18200 [compost metagenome]
MNKYRIIQNILIYTLLLVGAFLFYVVHIEDWMGKDHPAESSSKVNFIYQQF